MAARSSTFVGPVLRDHPLWHRYNGIKARCHNANHSRYKDYGARGIAMCERWRNSFAAFIEDVGPQPSPKHTLDRIDNDKGYEPGNVRWATSKEQSRNTSRNVYITVGDKTLTVRDWEAHNGVGRGAYQRRIDLGWDHVKAVTLPLTPGKPLRTR